MSLGEFAGHSVQRKEETETCMHRAECCSRSGCPELAVTRLDNQDLCLDHFCRRCYDLLERADGGRGRSNSRALREQLGALDECTRKALEVSLSSLKLNNLDRARLLDILLWSGDVASTLLQARSIPMGLSAGSRAERSEFGSGG